MISARDWYVRMCEMIGCQAHRRRPRRTAVLGKNGRPRLMRGRMQNVAIVAALWVCAMFQMWFSCGERCRSPNVRGLLLTFCGQGAKVCAAFILRKTAWPFCEGFAHGRPGHVFPHARAVVFARQNHHCTYINIRRAFCCALVGMTVALRASAILHARQIFAAAGLALFFTEMFASPKFGFR